jgi:hypothetical protein
MKSRCICITGNCSGVGAEDPVIKNLKEFLWISWIPLPTTTLFTRFLRLSGNRYIEKFFHKIVVVDSKGLFTLNTLKNEGNDKNRQIVKTYGKFPSGLTFMVRLIVA